MSNEYTNSELDQTVASVKEEFKRFIVKRRVLILQLGTAYEKAVGSPESICEEIKNVLQDEITQKLISRRDIERYCPDKWKKKTKPKNDKMSFSFTEDDSTTRKTPAKQQDKTITDLLTVEPNSLAERTSESAPSPVPLNCGNTDQENSKSLIDTSGRVIGESPLSNGDPESSTIVDSDKEKLYQRIQQVTAVSECPQCKKYEIQIQELRNERQPSEQVDFEFSMPFEAVRRSMESTFKETGGRGKVWFHGILNTLTSKVTYVTTGRAVGNMSDECREDVSS